MVSFPSLQLVRPESDSENLSLLLSEVVAKYSTSRDLGANYLSSAHVTRG